MAEYLAHVAESRDLRSSTEKFGCQSIRFELYSSTLAQLIGNSRSKSGSQFP